MRAVEWRGRKRLSCLSRPIFLQGYRQKFFYPVQIDRIYPGWESPLLRQDLFWLLLPLLRAEPTAGLHDSRGRLFAELQVLASRADLLVETYRLISVAPPGQDQRLF